MEDFSSMQQYFSECRIPIQLPIIRIKSIKEIKIDPVESGKYKLFLAYFNDNDVLNYIRTIFRVTEKNNIHILEFPQPSKQYYVADANQIPKKLLEELLPDKKGNHHYTFEEALQKLERYNITKILPNDADNNLTNK